MPFVTHPKRLSDVIHGEITDFDFCRTTETLISGQNLEMGTVLGMITASGKLTRIDLAASDGSESVYGVLLRDTDASGGDEKCVVLERGPALVLEGGLVFNDGATDANKTTIKTALLGKNIRVKAAV